jgi:hypothetical protein
MLRVRHIEEDRSGGGIGVWAGEVDTVREPGVRRTPSESIGIDYGPCSGPDLPADCPSTIKTSYNEVANGSTDEYSVSIGSPCFSNASALGGRVGSVGGRWKESMNGWKDLVQFSRELGNGYASISCVTPVGESPFEGLRPSCRPFISIHSYYYIRTNDDDTIVLDDLRDSHTFDCQEGAAACGREWPGDTVIMAAGSCQDGGGSGGRCALSPVPHDTLPPIERFITPSTSFSLILGHTYYHVEPPPSLTDRRLDERAEAHVSHMAPCRLCAVGCGSVGDGRVGNYGKVSSVWRIMAVVVCKCESGWFGRGSRAGCVSGLYNTEGNLNSSSRQFTIYYILYWI